MSKHFPSRVSHWYPQIAKNYFNKALTFCQSSPLNLFCKLCFRNNKLLGLNKETGQIFAFAFALYFSFQRSLQLSFFCCSSFLGLSQDKNEGKWRSMRICGISHCIKGNLSMTGSLRYSRIQMGKFGLLRNDSTWISGWVRVPN